MKYLKLYEGFQSESEVSKICKKFSIKNWSINSEGLVDVNSDVDLISKGLTKIPLKFGNVSGYFLCKENQLTSLEGSPKEVGGNFNCSYNNQLISLEGSPESVGGDFNCSYSNQLTSLDGSPRSVGVNFWCNNNQLTSLEGCPEIVSGEFSCSYNKLTSLEGCPERVGGEFYCVHNQLTSLKGCSKNIGGNFYCSNNQLTSLEGCPRSVGDYFDCRNNQLTSFEGPTYIDGNFLCDGNPIFNVWKIISPDGKWDNSIMDLFNDYDALRGNDIVLDRFNEFLGEIGLDPVKNVKGYNNI